jgi:cation transport regulator ChaC
MANCALPARCFSLSARSAQLRKQEIGVYGLGNVIVHACSEIFFLGPAHGVGRHRNDVDIAGGRRQRPNLRCGLDAAQFWHLNVHQDGVVLGVAYRIDGFQTVVHDINAVAGFIQQREGEPLIDSVVLR